MVEKEKIFEDALSRGKEGKVTEIQSWLTSQDLEIDDLDKIRNIFRENPELSAGFEEELSVLGEYIGRLEEEGGQSHIAIIGVNGIGKTQLLLLLQNFVEDGLENLEFRVLNAENFQKIEEENVLQKTLDELEENQRTVLCIDDAWKDKKIGMTLEKINSQIENNLIISTWTPEWWSELGGSTSDSAPTDKEITITPLSPKETRYMTSTMLEEIGEDGKYNIDENFNEKLHELGHGIPGLAIEIFAESINQAFMNELELFSREALENAIEMLKLKEADSLTKELKGVKKQIANQALRERDKRGIRPKKISETLGKSKSTISYHLRDLESKTILERNQVGRSTFYKLRDDLKPLIQLDLQGETEFYA